MISASVLQIGDIHYPRTREKRLSDVKDAGLGPITDAVSPPALARVFRAISSKIEEQSPAAILICGDLTEKGDQGGYEVCVEYLKTVLNLSSAAADSIHVVPGNHDVNRAICTLRDELNLNKFAPLVEAWKASFDDILATNGVREATLGVDDCKIQVYSMNSCVGCGEWRMLPAPIRDKMADFLEDLRASDPSAAFAVEGEQLDTPMFFNEDIELLNMRLDGLGLNTIPFVLAHHNLLPQELQRVEIYTELINGGQFRASLAARERPIVYCHGHIHADPIATISDNKVADSQLICVSAPEITDGFNEIVVHFSRDRKPLGLEVIPYRLRDSGTVGKAKSHRIPFGNRRLFVTDELEELKRGIKDDRTRFSDLAARVSIDRDILDEVLLEAAWQGMVDIDQQDLEPKFWVIRRRFV